MPDFTITVPRTYTFAEGWGVDVTPICAGEDEDGHPIDQIVDLDAQVVRIDASEVHIIGTGVHALPCIKVGHNAYAPVENFEAKDNGQYESRWFATRAEADDYAADVERRAEAIRSWFE